MKVIVVAVLLLLTICGITLSSAAPASSVPCFDMNYSTAVLVVDTKHSQDYIAAVYSNAKTQMQRTDILNSKGEESYVVLERLDLGKIYFHDVKNNTCHSEKIDGKIPESVCLPQDTTMVDQVTIGGALKANVWLQQSSSGPANRYVLSNFKNTPVNFFTKFDHDGAVSMDFVNFTPYAPSSSVFDVPEICKQEKNARPVVWFPSAAVRPVPSRMMKIASELSFRTLFKGN